MIVAEKELEFAASSTTAGVTVNQLREKIAAFGPTLLAGAAQVETARRVPMASIEALREAGYFEILKPRAFGGQEFDFSALVDLNIDLAKYCASTAWVAGLLSAHQWLVANFPEQAQKDVWSDPNALVCGSYAPVCAAQPADGGYVLSGRWSFASGCECAQWALCAAILPPGEGREKPAPAFLLVPATDYTIDDTWHVVGLAGTGSKTLVIDNVFVPAHRALMFSDTVTGKTPGAQLHNHNPVYAIPMLSSVPSCLASVAVGAAHGALEDYLARTSNRVTRGAVAGGQNKMAEFPTIQLRVAEAAASCDAAKKVLLSDLREREETVKNGQEISVEERITSRRGQAFSVSLAIRATEALNASTGGQGLDLSHPVQRAWRDANAVGRHISMNWDTVGTMYGQMALGLEPKGQY
ncbi:alkylation response protein AidB-like acyl-CoA dehydrogenase [Paraburkholderia bannensis]|uniref:Alkylation response protein AidB-like acyl-CoA dehydrogenase n=1 Tax=Paraburkholderia bannensis TaxID=765414 RepID=A0A7W9WUX8_9BURK|nr:MULTISPECIES: acyl-CoA dehydrogenase family protein [Paraburkholderia]MBB3259859.1 alkylation response protein AidB-like acyl-CoA dehydrogenase [Paraburkholderia sp. WP4_3_2]MBB6104831.1 alkylation response protein AidB-like acyl-CoA dehydrogenase [Paraburkholderia bannensis]